MVQHKKMYIRRLQLMGIYSGFQIDINYTTVDPKQFVFFKIETRACDVQSWEINVKDCKAETDTAVQSGGTHLKKEVRSPNSKPFGELFFKREHDAGHAAQSAGS